MRETVHPMECLLQEKVFLPSWPATTGHPLESSVMGFPDRVGDDEKGEGDVPTTGATPSIMVENEGDSPFDGVSPAGEGLPSVMAGSDRPSHGKQCGGIPDRVGDDEKCEGDVQQVRETCQQLERLLQKGPKTM
jgi:hypothetical protein